MSQTEAVVAFLLVTSISLTGYGSYRALRYAKGLAKIWGLVPPVIYIFGWLFVPLIGRHLSQVVYEENNLETPLVFSNIVYISSFVVMTLGAILGVLCIRFFYRSEE